MEKIGEKAVFRFWVILGGLAMIAIWFLPWRFATNDDEIMMWLVSGAYTGTPESYAVFIHPLLSWIFSKLYTVFPAIPWYPLTWFGVIYWSFLGFVFSLDKARLGGNIKTILSLFLLFLFLHFALFLQFTIVAGIAAFSGFLVLEIGYRQKLSTILVFGLSLIALSMLIRWESFLLIFIAFGFYWLCFRKVKDFINYAKLLLIPIFLFLTLMGSKIVWEKQSEYGDFLAYNKARAAVSDHPVSYKLISEEKLDLSSPWFFFAQWMMEDDQISIEDLKERKAELDIQFFSLEQVYNSFSRLISVLKAEAFKSVFSLILLLFYFYGLGVSRKSLFFASSWLVFFLLFNHFFILNGRVVVLFFLPFLIPLIQDSALKQHPKIVSQALHITLLLLFAYHLYNLLKEAKGRQIMQNEYLSLLEIVPENALLVIEGYKENYLGISYSMENPVPLYSLGWISKSPFQQKKLEKLGLTRLDNASDFYLIGVDVNDQYFFPEYMNYLSAGYKLASKTELDNFILFHYTKAY